MAFNFNDFMKGPGGAAAVNAVGGGLSAWGQAQSDKANRQQSAAQSAAQLRQQDYWNQQSQDTQRANGVLNADPLGADQTYAQRNALLHSILSNPRRSAPGDPGVAQAMGSGSGLTQMFANLDPNTINMFGPQATMSAITQRHQNLTNLDPRAATPDLTSMYGADAQPYVTQMQAYAHAAQNADAQTRAAYDAEITKLINEMAQKEGQPGFWHKLAKVAGVVGGIAATVMTGGTTSPLLIGALGAASGAASSWGSGSNPLMGAIIGGGTAYGGAKLAGPSTSIPNASDIGTINKLPGASLGYGYKPVNGFNPAQSWSYGKPNTNWSLF